MSTTVGPICQNYWSSLHDKEVNLTEKWATISMTKIIQFVKFYRE